MKRKYILFLIISLFCMTSCSGKNPFDGKYIFQMGKEKETHFGLSVDLKHDTSSKESNIGSFELQFTYKNFSNPFTFDDINVDDLGELKDYIDINAIGKDMFVDGGLVLKANGKFNISDFKQSDYTIKKLSFSDVSFLDLALSNEMVSYIEQVAVSYIEKNTINLVIPVSMNDLFLRLSWLGKYGEEKLLPETDDEFYHHTVKVTLLKQ